MRKLFIYTLVGLSLAGCDSSRDSGGAVGTGAVAHERTLHYSKAEDGSTVIQATRITNGQRAVDTAAGEAAVERCRSPSARQRRVPAPRGAGLWAGRCRSL